MKKIFLLSIFFLAACQARQFARYDGPGTFQDFAQARYQCAQEVVSNNNTATVRIQTDNSVPNSMVPRCDLFFACVTSKGYIRNQTSGKFNAADLPIECRNY